MQNHRYVMSRGQHPSVSSLGGGALLPAFKVPHGNPPRVTFVRSGGVGSSSRDHCCSASL